MDFLFCQTDHYELESLHSYLTAGSFSVSVITGYTFIYCCDDELDYEAFF